MGTPNLDFSRTCFHRFLAELETHAWITERLKFIYEYHQVGITTENW